MKTRNFTPVAAFDEGVPRQSLRQPAGNGLPTLRRPDDRSFRRGQETCAERAAAFDEGVPRQSPSRGHRTVVVLVLAFWGALGEAEGVELAAAGLVAAGAAAV